MHPVPPLSTAKLNGKDAFFPFKTPEERGHPVFLAQAVLAEFGEMWWKAPGSDIKLRQENTPDSDIDPTKGRLTAFLKKVTGDENLPTVEDELKLLIYLGATERPRRLPEIVAQAADVRPYWNSMLGASLLSSPAVCTLIEIGLAVGQMVAMHYKYKYNRMRPFQIYPGLLPPITTPPHPAYPNGHALQSLLIAACVTQALNPSDNPVYPSGALLSLAERIGENREVAGVHFPTDRLASEMMVEPIMARLAQGTLFQRIAARASAELPAGQQLT